MRGWKGCAALALLVVLLATGCTGGGAAPSSSAPAVMWASEDRAAVQSGELQFQPPGQGALTVTLSTSKGDIVALLYPDIAPLAVQNFCALAEEGYYNGTDFHRVVENFIIQGGDASGEGQGGKSIWGKAFRNEYSDKLHHYSGALCMAAPAGTAEGNLSQFYIVATPPGGFDEAAAEAMRAAGMREEVVQTYLAAGGAPYLDYGATVFGQVIQGMDVVDAIARVSVDEGQRPRSAVTVESVSVTWPVALFPEEQPAPAPAESVAQSVAGSAAEGDPAQLDPAANSAQSLPA